MRNKDYGLGKIIVLTLILIIITVISINFFAYFHEKSIIPSHVSIEADSAIY